MLRRGAAEGWAEVDFIGSDGTGYRSRWSVRRAHGKHSGKLQASEIRFSRIAGDQVLGDHRKTETLRQIVEQSVNRSAVYDVLTNGVPVSIGIETA